MCVCVCACVHVYVCLWFCDTVRAAFRLRLIALIPSFLCPLPFALCSATSDDEDDDNDDDDDTEEDEQEWEPREPLPPSNPEVGRPVRAIYDYGAEDDEEITVAAGDGIRLVSASTAEACSIGVGSALAYWHREKERGTGGREGACVNERRGRERDEERGRGGGERWAR